MVSVPISFPSANSIVYLTSDAVGVILIRVLNAIETKLPSDLAPQDDPELSQSGPRDEQVLPRVEDAVLLRSLAGMASTVASSVVSRCGDVILDLLQGGNISNSGNAGTSGDVSSDDDLHLLRDGEGGGDYDGDNRNGDLYLS
nr:hypothetical protein [Tanacetum cinerariifolium]